MPRDMFGDVVDPSIKVGGQKWYTVPLSILVHTVLIARGHHRSVAGGGCATRSAVDDGLRRCARPPRRPPPPPPPPSAPTPRPFQRTSIRTRRQSRLRRKSSRSRASTPGSRAVWRAVSKAVCQAAPSAGSWAVFPKLLRRPPPPAAPVRVGGNIKAPTKTKMVNPVYPPIAQSARVQGIVIIEATIGPNGTSAGGQGAALDSASGSGGARCGQAVGVHADPAERRACAGHHDRHGPVHAPVGGSDHSGIRNIQGGGWDDG